jgi:hypothetical protein
VGASKLPSLLVAMFVLLNDLISQKKPAPKNINQWDWPFLGLAYY